MASLPEGALTKKEVVFDKAQVYLVTAGKLARLYAPAIGLFAAGFASIFVGFGMIKHWHALAVSAVSALDKKYRDYRGNVIKELGTEMDQRFAGEVIEKKTAKIKTIDSETGEEKETEREAVSLDNLTEDDFTRIFDYHSSAWESDFLYNDALIRSKIHEYTIELQRYRVTHIFMNRMCCVFDVEENGAGQFYGWTSKPRASVRIKAIPFIKIFNSDDDNQFPMVVEFPVIYNEDDGAYDFADPKDHDLFKEYYRQDERNCGWKLIFEVDTDENGVPKPIYNDVFGSKK
jgi:hypothetical protein